jgi:hypothetical protein
LTSATALQAQEAPQFPEPVKEHEWLKQFVGKWESESEVMMGPDQPAIKSKGSATARMLGGFWVVVELTGEMGGVTMHGLQTIGYDPEKSKYFGTWVDSMTSYLWRYLGSVDESGKILTLEADGPSFMTAGKTAKFRDAYEFKSKDHVVFTSSMQTEDGKWITFMTGHMRRVE